MSENVKVPGEIHVYENGFAFETEVLVSTDIKEVAQFLCDKGCYNGPMVMDGGFFMCLPDGKVMYQGSSSFNKWIESALGLPAPVEKNTCKM